MNIDITTLLIFLGITYIILVTVVSLQYIINKSYNGIGWWTSGFLLISLGFLGMPLRNIPAIENISIILSNSLALLGMMFLYTGVKRFFDKNENRIVLAVIFLFFLISIIIYTYINNNLELRIITTSLFFAAIFFLIAHTLFFNKIAYVKASANFNFAVITVFGIFFILRAMFYIFIGSISSFFSTSFFQVSLFMLAFIEGILITFGFIIMVNQRLNAEMKEAKENSELIFNTGPDAALIIRLTDGCFIDINEGFTRLSGFSREEIIGKYTTEFNVWKNPDDLRNIVAAIDKNGFCENMEVLFSRKDGKELNGLVSAKLITLQGLPHIISLTRDITDRKLAEKKISTLLAEKELILKEVHHRIKNNMNTVKSILALQAYSVTDPASITALKDAEGRVQSMMVLYDKLYQSADFTEISVGNYISSLVDEIVSNFPNSKSVRIEKRLNDFPLGIKLLQSLGIIINELLTNMMKYAFIDKDNGMITVSSSIKGDRVSFVIEDNGCGLPESINFDNSTGFGMQLVHMLTEQIGGSIKIERGAGTKFILEFDKY